MGAFSKFGTAVKKAIGKLEDRNDRRAGEIVASIAQALDESDAVTGLTEDLLDAAAGKYEFVGRFKENELVFSLRKRVDDDA